VIDCAKYPRGKPSGISGSVLVKKKKNTTGKNVTFSQRALNAYWQDITNYKKSHTRRARQLSAEDYHPKNSRLDDEEE